MIDKPYAIVIRFKAKAGKEESFRHFLEAIVKIAYQSKGCIQHDLHRSLADPAEFLFYERWVNKEAHKHHVLRPEVKQWRSELESYLTRPYEVSFWEIL